MLQVYRKVEKSLDNPYGVVSIQSLKELDKPFLLCLSAQDNHPKSVFGMIKEGARAARVNTTDEMAAGFKINEFPVAFLGVKFIKDDLYQKNYEEMVDTFIYPFLIGDGTRSVEEIQRAAKKINFMTYCDGTLTYANIEQRLEEKLQLDGYSESDIKDILAQISLVALGTMVNTSKLKATTATFIDVNDSEIYTTSSERYKRILQAHQQRGVCGTFRNSNNVLYIFEGNGNHSLKEYFSDNNMAKPAISGILSAFLQNSIDNENTNNLGILSSNQMYDLITKYGDEKEDPVTLLRNLDASLNYDGAPRYSKEEAKLRHELDVSYAEIGKMRMQLESAERGRDQKAATLKQVVDGIREYSSETTFYQILVPTKLWQAPSDRDVFQEESDKSIRQAYEESLAIDVQNQQIEGGPKL